VTALAHRLAALLGLAVALAPAGCLSQDFDRVGGQQEGERVVLTMANPLDDSEELERFVDEVARLSDNASASTCEATGRTVDRTPRRS
jgi:hypothetical protein